MPTPTRFTSWSRSRAVLLLSGTLLAILLFLAAVPKGTLIPASYSSREDSDLAVFEKVVVRVHSGENYYDAMGGVLRSSKRPTGYVFNWRTPLHLTFVSLLPDLAWGRFLLGAVAVTAILMSFVVMARNGPIAAAGVQLLLLLGPVAGCFSPSGVYFSELWAGALIVVSVCGYALGSWPVGFVAGLLALFCRELAAPYVVVCIALALYGRRRGEVLGWLGGLGAYSLYFAFHALAVTSRLGPTDFPPPAGWIQFGGPGFILQTSSMGWLLVMPAWVAALYVPLAVLGLAAWKSEVGLRLLLGVAAYLCLFALAGHSVHLYWGAVYSPLLSFGVAWCGLAMRDLLRSARRMPGPA